MDEALSQWRDGADAGDRRAMLELGRLYRQGLGVVQDYVEAHKWLNLAASRGEAVALEERDALAAKMTPEQVAGAQERAAAWQPGDDLALDEESSSVPAADTGQPPPQAIRAAQSLLAALGYPSGPADGIWGQGTRAAYQAFLRDAGLPQAEVLTPQALRTMRAVAEQQAIAQTEDGTTIAGSAQTPASPETNVPAPVSPDALHNAAQVGDIKVLKAAIAAGVDVNASDSRGWTALMHAVNKKHVPIVESLIEAGVDLNIRAPDEATALFMAVVLRHTGIVELLMKGGADIFVNGPGGRTIVDMAKMRYGEVDVAIDNGEPPAVLALLEGKLWMGGIGKLEMLSIPAGTFRMGDSEESTTSNCIVHSEANTFPAACPVATLEPLCTGEIGSGCWMEVTNQIGCYIWNPNPQRGEKVTWSGCCVDCKISGKGEVVWRYLKDGSRWVTSTSEGYTHGGYTITGTTPAHDVTVPAFRLGKHEVTFAQWEACVADGGCNGYIPYDEGWLRNRGNHPVINVNWYSVQLFIEWLNSNTGGNYRLPTEAEWEYAARAGSITDYSWGNDLGNNQAVCAGCGSRWDGRKAAPVGSFPANAWGLHDMHGNVWEWVQDCWNDSYHGAPADGSAWTSGHCSQRVVRGGAWSLSPVYLRSATRYGDTRSVRGNLLGFRLAHDE